MLLTEALEEEEEEELLALDAALVPSVNVAPLPLASNTLCPRPLKPTERWR